MRRLLSTRAFAEAQGLTEGRIRQLLLEGRIPEATRVGRRWLIPEGARILDHPPAGREAPRERRGVILTFFNHAGGVGKTSLARDLGFALKDKGLRVLLVDVDPQANLSHWLGVRAREEETLLRLPESGLPEPRRLEEGLDLIPSSLRLALLEVRLFQLPLGGLLLRNALEPLRERYDLILVDSPPSLGQLTTLAALAGDGFIAPLETSGKGLEAVEGLLEAGRTYARALGRPADPFVRLFVPTKYDPRLLVDREIMERIYALAQVAPVSPPVRHRPGLYKRAALTQTSLLRLGAGREAVGEILNVAESLLQVAERLAREVVRGA